MKCLLARFFLTHSTAITGRCRLCLLGLFLPPVFFPEGSILLQAQRLSASPVSSSRRPPSIVCLNSPDTTVSKQGRDVVYRHDWVAVLGCQLSTQCGWGCWARGLGHHQQTFLGPKTRQFKPLARCLSPSTPTPAEMTRGKERLNTHSTFCFRFCIYWTLFRRVVLGPQ